MPSLKNGWTGGQYSFYRIVFGLYLACHFASLALWPGEWWSGAVLPDAGLSPLNILTMAGSPQAIYAILGAAVVATLLFAAGVRDRLAAFLIWYVWACFLERNLLIGVPGSVFLGWPLLFHVFLPAAPYGSLAARRRADPAGNWRMPPALYAAAWIAMAVTYAYIGAMKWTNPSWLNGSGGLPAAMLAIHAVTFNPAWVRPSGAVTAVQYDGRCALCHGFVRFLVAEGPPGIRFFPMTDQRSETIRVRMEDGRELDRSNAVAAALRCCGGLWRIIAEAILIIPRPARDVAYNIVAKVRHRLFGRTNDVCPLIPQELRSRIADESDWNTTGRSG